MRYFLLSSPASLSLRERESAETTRLIALNGLGHRLCTSRPAAALAAIPITSVTESAEKESLSAALAGSYAKRIHGTRCNSVARSIDRAAMTHSGSYRVAQDAWPWSVSTSTAARRHARPS
jgi:hypothetical protein